jgi:hypothetical protein
VGMKAATAAGVLLCALAVPGQAPATLTLELRVFNGAEEVTRHSRATVHRAGERAEPVAHISPSDKPLELTLAEGIYDAQVIHEQEGRVVNIRWANRLVVMRYPDEGGRHLEVINFRNGFGALQVRTDDNSPLEVACYAPGRKDKPAAHPLRGINYALFVVPAGAYDVQTRIGGRLVWHTGIEVPLDRTRFWMLPASDQ